MLFFMPKYGIINIPRNGKLVYFGKMKWLTSPKR